MRLSSLTTTRLLFLFSLSPYNTQAPTPTRMMRGTPPDDDIGGAIAPAPSRALSRRMLHQRLELLLDSGCDLPLLTRLLDAAGEATSSTQRNAILNALDHAFDGRRLGRGDEALPYFPEDDEDDEAWVAKVDADRQAALQKLILQKKEQKERRERVAGTARKLLAEDDGEEDNEPPPDPLLESMMNETFGPPDSPGTTVSYTRGELSFRLRAEIAASLNRILDDPQHIPTVLEIIQQERDEIDLNQLDTRTWWRLHDFIKMESPLLMEPEEATEEQLLEPLLPKGPGRRDQGAAEVFGSNRYPSPPTSPAKAAASSSSSFFADDRGQDVTAESLAAAETEELRRNLLLSAYEEQRTGSKPNASAAVAAANALASSMGVPMVIAAKALAEAGGDVELAMRMLSEYNLEKDQRELMGRIQAQNTEVDEEALYKRILKQNAEMDYPEVTGERPASARGRRGGSPPWGGGGDVPGTLGKPPAYYGAAARAMAEVDEVVSGWDDSEDPLAKHFPVHKGSFARQGSVKGGDNLAPIMLDADVSGGGSMSGGLRPCVLWRVYWLRPAKDRTRRSRSGRVPLCGPQPKQGDA